MVQRGDGPSFPLEASAELLSANLDGDLAAQARVHNSINTADASGADWSLDLVGSKLGAGGQHGGRRVGGRVSVLCQQRFDLAAQLDIALACLVQKRAPPAGLVFE